MLKNKPWQLWAMLAVHSITLAYVVFELVRLIIPYPFISADYAAALVLGGASLFFLFRGSMAGLVLEVFYFLSLFYCRFYFVDVFAVIILIAVFALQKPVREYFKTDFKAQIKRTVITSAIVIAAAVLATVFLHYADRMFYITNSKADLDKITAYITETYGSSAEIDDSSYKETGYVYITASGGEHGSVRIYDDMIMDGIIIDKMQLQYEEKLNEGLEYREYYVTIYRSFENYSKLRANLYFMGFPASVADGYDENSLNHVYQVFLQMIDDGLEVSISPRFGPGFFSGISYMETRSLLFPFLNSVPAEYTAPPPSSVEFTEKCSIEEFTKRITENITENQQYEATYLDMYTQGSSYSYHRTRNISFAVAILILLPFYVMQAVALSAMTKRRGLSKPWLAWIPQVSQYLLAKISDDTDTFHGCGKTLAKRTLIILALTAILIPVQVAVDNQNSVISLINWVVSLASTITLFQSAFRVYDAYLPQKATSRKVLSFFFSAFAIPVILFRIRHKDPVQTMMPPESSE